MEWTTEKPTRDGTYWSYDGYRVKSVTVHFYGYDAGDFEIFGMSETIDGDIDPIKITHWMGPLPMPEPPTEQT